MPRCPDGQGNDVIMSSATSCTRQVPCLLFEDQHILVVNKPAGWNTHAPEPYAGEGIYDWLRHRCADWASLAIVHRLDKETSGVLLFAKTPLANRSITAQFANRQVSKRYLFLTDGHSPTRSLTVKSTLIRNGARYLSRPARQGDMIAETTFCQIGRFGAHAVVEAQPLTGRTHQVRAQAAAAGFPVLGDELYAGPQAARVFLHAASIALRHPATNELVQFATEPNWEADSRLALRAAIIDANITNAFRLLHGAADGCPGWFVDRLGDFLLVQTQSTIKPTQIERLTSLRKQFGLRGVYHQSTERKSRSTRTLPAVMKIVDGHSAEGPETPVLENGIRYLLRFSRGSSVGLFLDQRDNRRRILTNHVAAGFPCLGKEPTEAHALNLFAYTCGFSVCAALNGIRTTNVDLSRNYLEWGRLNFTLNGLDPAQHEFLVGDALEWLRRFRRAQRRFDLVMVDPPTFSTSKHGGTFRAERDYRRLVDASVPLIREGGVLFASCNAGGYEPRRFVRDVLNAIKQSRRDCVQWHYAPQPPDFPISRVQPAHLKSAWLRLGA